MWVKYYNKYSNIREKVGGLDVKIKNHKQRK